MNLSDEVAAQRRVRGWTQEDLAHRSGLSVRTIRNLELGAVRNPRRSSVDRLARILDIGHPPARAAAIAPAVRANRLTTLVGPAGIGKTRLALGVAAELAGSFRDGVAVAELGDLAAEHVTGASQEPAIARRVAEVTGPGDGDRLLILDTAEHVPAGTIAVARRLLARSPGTHLVITARRRLTDRLGVNREVAPLTGQAAVDLLVRHAGVEPAVERPELAELCRRLGGIPRYLEFAGERMRTVPIRHLLAGGPSLDMLSTGDHALLPHQRSVAAGIGWDLDLLPAGHRRLLGRLAARAGETFTFDDVVAEHEGRPEDTPADPMITIAELVGCPLVQPAGPERHRYRLAPYVADYLRRHGAA
jgi:predicted ATPase/DNA-binding XRE family transcriptional regulator